MFTNTVSAAKPLEKFVKVFNKVGKIMMYRCCDCGHLFEEGEQAVREETHGLDSPPYEK